MSLSDDLLEQMLSNLRLLSRYTLREVDATDISGSQTLQPSQKFTMYEQGKLGGTGARTGEVFFVVLTTNLSNWVIRVTVDDYEAVISPRTSELLTAGVTIPNKAVWAVNPVGGVFTLVSVVRYPFERYVKVEGQNVGTNSSTAVSYVMARLFNPAD